MQENSTTPTYLNRLTRWGDTTWARDHADVLVDALGTFRDPKPSAALRRALAGCGYAKLTDGALSVVTSRKLIEDPEGASELDAFVRDSVSIAAPHTAYAAVVLMPQVSRYVDWCVRKKGWPLDGRVIWSVRAIDIYSTTANLQRSEGTRRNYRALLMRVSEVLLPDEHPERPTPLSRRTTLAPYTRAEMETFRDWAGQQLTDVKRDRAMVMLVLCAGAGIRPNEVALIESRHVQSDDEGVLIHVPSDPPRDVPLLAEWEEWMAVLLERRPADETLWGPTNRRNTHNLTSVFTEGSNGNPPRADRLRNTWLAHHLTFGTPMKDLHRAAGLEKFGQLHLLLEHVPSLSETEYRRALRSGGQA